MLELPQVLGERFSVRDAAVLGVSAGRLRRRDLTSPFHGVRARLVRESEQTHDRNGRPLSVDEREHLACAADYMPRAGDRHFFSHVTAAVVHGIPLPGGLLRARPVDVSVFRPDRLPRARGVRGHEAHPRTTRVCVDGRTGFPVADGASTWAMLGSVLTDPYDLVAAADSLVRDWRAVPESSIEQLGSLLSSGRRVGAAALREALPRVRSRSASRPESWLRLTLIDAGLPEPDLNFDVWQNGMRLGCVDQAYPSKKVALEYEGEHHRLSAEQWTRDIQRYDALRAAGWIVIQVTKVDLFARPHEVVLRVRRALASRS